VCAASRRASRDFIGMVQLTFKSGPDALDYVEKFFGHDQISPNCTCYGVIKFIDRSGSPDVFMIEVVALTANIITSKVALKRNLQLSKVGRVPVSATTHPELDADLEIDDLVVWGCLEAREKFPIGVILHKCKLEMDEKTKQFLLSEKTSTNSISNKSKVHKKSGEKPIKSLEQGVSVPKDMSQTEFIAAAKMGLSAWERNLDLQYSDLLRSSEI